MGWTMAIAGTHRTLHATSLTRTSSTGQRGQRYDGLDAPITATMAVLGTQPGLVPHLSTQP